MNNKKYCYKIYKGESMTDREYMQIAIDISSKEEYPYGAIIVKDDKIVGRSDGIIKC